MKKITLVILTSLVLSAVSFAQSNHQVGAWSTYTTSGQLDGNKMVLLQTASPAEKLDVICKNNRVVAVAVEPKSRIDQHLVSYESPVPTVHLRFASIGMIEVSEDWAVADEGRSLTPYAEISQGTLNRTWVDRLSGTDKIVLSLDGRAGSQAQSTFDTRELKEALSAVGCTR